MYRPRPVLIAVLTLSSLTLYGQRNASAQSVYVTSDRTIAGGNPLSGNYDLVQVGSDAASNPYPNLTADITGGTIDQYVNALNGSTVNIHAGTIGALPVNSTYTTALNIALGSTVNLSGGTLQSFADVRNSAAGGAINNFNVSGGTINSFVINEGDGLINISAGTITDYVANYGSGTINVTGGSLSSLSGFDFNGVGTINFGGTATVNSISASGGTTNISGGTIGAPGVTVRNTGVANFTGSALTVTPLGSSAVFDDGYYVNLIVSAYSITGTLSSGAPLNTTVSAGESFTNDGLTATFNAPALAPDLYVTTDQSVTGVYNNINVGIDPDFNPSNPTATIAPGTDTVFLSTYSNSTTNMTGGIVRGFLYVAEQSHFNMSAGEVPGGIDSEPGTTLNISGGSTPYLGVGGTATISGGVIDSIDLHQSSTLIVQGTGLSATGSAGHFWDPNTSTNYLLAGNFQITGALADGTPIDQTVVASAASGTPTQQTIAGPQPAPNVYILSDGAVNTIYNLVSIGTNEDGSVNTSPTVAFAAGADLGNVYLRNQSTLNIQAGEVHGTIYASADTVLNISGGTVGSVYQSGSGAGKITVSGGSTTYIAPANQILVTAGELGTLDTYAGAQVRVEGGNVTTMLLFGGTPNTTNVTILAGDVGTIDFRTRGNLLSILGGSIGEIWGGGGTALIYGGLIDNDTLLNFRATPTLFDIFGENLTLSDAQTGTYTDSNGNTYTGVWWTLSGTLTSGDPLNTHYFERNGSLSAPTNLTFNTPIPEPTSLLGLLALTPIPLLSRRRSAR